MAKQKQNHKQNTKTDFDDKAAREQAWNDLLTALDLPTEEEQADAIVVSLARGAYIKKHKSPPSRDAIPTANQIIQRFNKQLIEAANKSEVAALKFLRNHRWGGTAAGIVGTQTRWLKTVNGEVEHPLAPHVPHPLSPEIEAWQKDVTAVHATKDHDKRHPAGILKYPMGTIRDVSLVETGAGVLKNLSGHGQTPTAYQMALPGLEQKAIIRPTQNFLVQERKALTTKSGAVSLAVRIALEAVMALPGNLTEERINFRLGDLIDYLNPDGKFHRTNQLKYILTALQTLNSNAVVVWEYKKGKTGFWLPVVARSFPGMDSDRDFPIVLDVELPPNATQGPMALKEAVRMTGKRSVKQFNAYLSAVDVWDRYGTQSGRITDPTRPVDYKQPGGERERDPKTDQYPILSNLDLMTACYPNLNFESMPGNKKRAYLARAKAAWEELKKRGYVEIEKVDDVGWRILPTEDHAATYRALKKKV